ncbi:MAG: hypothetical protein ACYC26_02985 [Phycisphaerales bacterium]
MRTLSLVLIGWVVVVLGGCQSYVTPAGRADFAAFSSPAIEESFRAKPAAVLPAHLAAVRVQASQYQDYYTRREGGVYGSGRYSVVTAHEVEDDADFQRIARMPDVGGLISISTLLLPEQLTSDRELREAAARLKADMLLIYTFDTRFHTNDSVVALNVISLGLFPSRKVYVTVTCSALVIDTRTGFVYSALDTTEKREMLTNAWESGESADRARRDAEKAAFKSLVGELERNWPRIVERTKQGA